MLTSASCHARVADAITRRAWTEFGPGWPDWLNVRSACAFLLSRAFAFPPVMPDFLEITTDTREGSPARYYRHYDGRVLDRKMKWNLWHAFLFVAERPEFYAGDPLDWTLRLLGQTL